MQLPRLRQNASLGPAPYREAQLLPPMEVPDAAQPDPFLLRDQEREPLSRGRRGVLPDQGTEEP